MRPRTALFNTLLLTALLALPGGAAAQQASSDVFLLPIEGTQVGAPKRLTDHPGYDNQPQFLPGGQVLVYTSIGATGADIWRYDLATGARERLTNTPESEYSPTPIPGRNAISVVRDYGDLKQQLWSVPLDGAKPELLLPGVNPVGYHAWVDTEQLLLFVLGEPNTLQLARIGPEAGRVLSNSPGRVLGAIPGGHELSFVDKSEKKWWVTAFDPASGDTRQLVETLEGREDYAWAPDGALWMGDDSRLYRWTPGSEGWSEVADLDARGIRGITRLAFAPDGRSLAVVGAQVPDDLAAEYRVPAGQILGSALTDVEGWEKLSYLTTVIGHRLSGSKGLEDAISWASKTMADEGLTVRTQAVKVPHWVRGNESAVVTAPVERTLSILGLGGSVGTRRWGIKAPVVVVKSFDELDALGRAGVEGKIVLYAVEWQGYGSVQQYRANGASRAAALGAVAVLTRSATALSLNTPHTGALRYDEAQPKIPAAAVSVEDADWMRRMAELGRELTVKLTMQARTLPDAADSFNVIAEIPGSERPEEVVVMGGHFDSWDVGQGAHDDGAACIAAWQALRIIDQLGLRPRRTLRVVLWTNEENGLAGGTAYRDALSDGEVARHVAAIEMDGGAERPTGFGLGMQGIDPNAKERDPRYEAAFKRMQQIAKLLAAIDADEIERGGGGSDIGPLMRSGVPGLGLQTVGEHYFDWHHTAADTLDKVDPQNFRRAIALLGVAGYVLADMPERLLPAPSE
jgi:hypothetical protein